MMRFIRDIIKEKRGDDTGTKSGGHASRPPIAAEPLMLNDPLMAEDGTFQKLDAEPSPAKPPLTAPAMPMTAHATPTAAPVRVQAKMENPAPASKTAAQFTPPQEPVAEDGDEEFDSDAELFSEADPFEKLRESGQLDMPVRKTVSPMRTTNVTPENTAERGAVKPETTARPVAATPEPSVEPVAAKPEAAVEPAPEKPAEKVITSPLQEDMDALTPAADAMEQPVSMPAPAKGRGSARSGRVKTRLLGFSAGSLERTDPFEKKPSTPVEFPVGWLVVVSEKGRGASFSLNDGVTKVGRGTDQTVSLNFGDNSISRDNHVSIAFDAETNKFFIGHSGKTNLVRINNVPLLSTEELKSKDLIRLGETTLRFIAFCEEDFSWAAQDERVAKHA